MEYQLPLQAFLHRAQHHANTPFLHQPENSSWQTLSWAQVDTQARRIAMGLLEQGYQPGDKIALLAKNCAQWFIADIAITMAGLISIPIYTSAGVETINHILAHSAAKAIFIGRLDCDKAIKQANTAHILRIALPATPFNCDEEWEQWLARYPALTTLAEPKADETMTIVYTSGSTGLPKGVVLSHQNIAASSSATAQLLGVNENDRGVSYLPLAHIVERCGVEWMSIYSGLQIFFVESLALFLEGVQHAQPTVFVSVPRLWSNFQSGVLTQLGASKLQRLLCIPIVKSIIAKKIRKNLGLNACHTFFSGSAPIAPKTLHWFRQLGINISEGWGMTETAGLSCASAPFSPETIGTIGRPLPRINMKLSDTGEILIRGDAVFSAYYQNPEASDASFSDGWFHTGDCAKRNENGVYTIIGRMKEHFKTGKGKYVAPAPIESMLSSNTDIEAVCVLGSGRKQPIALVCLSANIPRNNEVHDKLLDTLQSVNLQLEIHTKLDHLIVCANSWSVNNDLLTPTLKIRRNKVEAYYDELIHEEYPDTVVWQADL